MVVDDTLDGENNLEKKTREVEVELTSKNFEQQNVILQKVIWSPL